MNYILSWYLCSLGTFFLEGRYPVRQVFVIVFIYWMGVVALLCNDGELTAVREMLIVTISTLF